MLGREIALPEPPNPLYAYVNAFIDELQRAGVQDVVICPGSRSTPLAIACAAHPGIKVWMHLDERSAAFFGLGLAKQIRRPVGLLCTSGTAAANFLPALIEAMLTHVPLLALTADRPHELRDNGAPQAIDQNRLYGTYVKWFVDVALPEATNEALRYIRTLANRAVALTTNTPAGPVHLNFPFREPLTPEPIADQPLLPPEERDAIAWYGRPENKPFISVTDAPLAAPPTETLQHLAARLKQTPRGLIIAGPQDDPALPEALLSLAKRLRYPILADPLSLARCGPHAGDLVLSSYDAFLRDASFVKKHAPEIILRFGAMPTSKPVLLYLKRYSSCPLIVIDGQQGWEEPTQLASELIHAKPVLVCQQILRLLEEPGAGAESDEYAARRARGSAWHTIWIHADQLTRQALQEGMDELQPLFEGRVFSELAALLPEDTTLYVGNSMPVRDLDTFFWASARSLRILGNRGANGIDGVISSALGASAGARAGSSTVLVIGDLSFLHDLGGLVAAHLHHLSLTIVLINNDGGGIFSFLPQANHPTHFEPLFGIPTGLDMSLAVQMYGGQFHRAGSWEHFRQTIAQGISGGGLQVIEVQTERASNVQMHRHLWQRVSQALEHMG
jgi:2-succinyl-5-enolpyruvyl-6-hydroxy-3-cyclohexene-1-carboxylate synthase